MSDGGQKYTAPAPTVTQKHRRHVTLGDDPGYAYVNPHPPRTWFPPTLQACPAQRRGGKHPKGMPMPKVDKKTFRDKSCDPEQHSPRNAT